MKINEIIVEGRDGKISDLAHDHASTSQGITRFRDGGGFDRTYNLNRVMMAAAMADGKSTRSVDMPQSSWYSTFNTTHPYTDEEHKMMQSAFNTVNTEHEEVVKRKKSEEHKETHKVSPVAARRPNKHGV